jgi:hypothetical protein
MSQVVHTVLHPRLVRLEIRRLLLIMHGLYRQSYDIQAFELMEHGEPECTAFGSQTNDPVLVIPGKDGAPGYVAYRVGDVIVHAVGIDDEVNVVWIGYRQGRWVVVAFVT